MSWADASHRPVSSFREAVAEWNRRLTEDGWRSSFAPQLTCPTCAAVGAMLSTICGHTHATCTACSHRWEL
jgi:hypothetical protein